MTSAPPNPTATKRAKLLRRTWVGSTIAAALIVVLWAASALDSALPVLGVSLAVLALSIFEVARMGTLAGRGLGLVLGSGALVVALASVADLERVAEPSELHRDAGFGALWLLSASLWGALVIVHTHALVRSSSIIVRAAALLALTAFAAGAFGLETQTCLYLVVTLSIFVALRLVVIGAERRAEALGVILLGTLLVVSIPGLAWVWLGFDHFGLVALLAICKLGDTAGYYVGSTLGRHHPFPAISPGKTSEGCAGSLLASAVAGALAVQIGWLPSAPYGLLGGALGGGLVNIAAQASDLLESWVKRRAGVKDSGTWFGPSGGMLDLVDSFFLATPVALVTWPVVFRFAE